MVQVVNEHAVHELVLRHRLHHEHPLLPQVGQHLGDVHVEIVVDAEEQDVAEDGDPGSTDAGGAVDEDGRVAVAAGGDLGGGVGAEGGQLLEEGEEGGRVGGAAVVGPVGELEVPHGARAPRGNVGDLEE